MTTKIKNEIPLRSMATRFVFDGGYGVDLDDMLPVRGSDMDQYPEFRINRAPPPGQGVAVMYQIHGPGLPDVETGQARADQLAERVKDAYGTPDLRRHIVGVAHTDEQTTILVAGPEIDRAM